MHMLSELQISSGTRLLLKTVGIQFLSTANKEGFFRVKLFYKSRWKERAYRQAIADVCVMGETAVVSPCLTVCSA